VDRSDALYLAIGLLVLIIAVLSYQLYLEGQKPEAIQINANLGGLLVNLT
jgi:hypothetical protein